MMDPTNRSVGRSQATTDAHNRVGRIHRLIGFRHAVTKDEGDESRRGSLGLETVRGVTSSDY